MKFFDLTKDYHFRFQHITVIFGILIVLQFVISYINKATIKDFLSTTQEWYQRGSAEELAHMTTANLELLLETIDPDDAGTPASYTKIKQSFNIIFSQQLLQHNIRELCVIVQDGDIVRSIDDGILLYSYLYTDTCKFPPGIKHPEAVKMYSKVAPGLTRSEEIETVIGENGDYNIFVPLVVKGEYLATVYIKMQPDFSQITEKIIASYNESSIIYFSLILLGLVAMYFVSSYTVRERDEVQQKLMLQHSENLAREINYEKELLFTKRIYHTHHKAEKIMGFIKDDLRAITPESIHENQSRMIKYSNFISRVIYDMKWYDPPIQTIRDRIFRTDLNEVITFLVNNVFMRISTKVEAFSFNLNLEPGFPPVHINEYVVWEILEPIIQNSIDHGGDHDIVISITTRSDKETGTQYLTIEDNGKGIDEHLLKTNEKGVKNLFLESVTTKKSVNPNSGYGCYIAHEISKRCGWLLDAENLPEKGCIFTITINKV